MNSDLFKKFDYAQINKILKILMSLSTKKKEFLLLIEQVKFNTNKILLFNQIWNLIKK